MAVAQRMDLKQGVSQERVKTLSAKGRPIDDEKEAEVILSPILPRINSPADMKSLNENQLTLLAQEIREEIIRTVSKNGGHLASSLGTVELAIALHYVFDTPRDKIVWDVGHQAYAHKLLTGRRDRFYTLRQDGGISGFLKRAESAYDAFDAGHSSTSISAALGITAAKCFKGEKAKIIAVIGDGSMTAGLAFEGLNQAGHLDKNLIVILNDNEMSISKNVGALSAYFSRKLTGRTVVRFKKDVERRLKSLSGVGENIIHVLKKVEESFKGFFTPGMLFEALKFEYIGPISGHDFGELIPILRNLEHLEGPVLVHVLTKKGKGYKPAEERPDLYHGVGPFDIETGEIRVNLNCPMSYTKVFGNTLIRLASEDKKIVAITAAMPEGTGLNDFSEKFPERFFDVGIAEQHAVTFAAGLASEGLSPVVAIYSTFLQRAYDQIAHDVCLPNLPVTFALDRGGIVGEDGPTHHGLFDFAYLRHLPNMVVMAPKDENELQHMLYTAVKHPGPAAVRYPRGAGEGIPLDQCLNIIPIGKAEVLREGDDLLILAIGVTVNMAVQAAKLLAESGISATVVNSRFVKPLDEELIVSRAQRSKAVLTVEEHVLDGGFGSAILELFERRNILDKPLKRIGVPDRFVEHGSQKKLRERYGLTAESIAEAGLSLLKG